MRSVLLLLLALSAAHAQSVPSPVLPALEHGTITGPVLRDYRLLRPAAGPAPLVIALHALNQPIDDFRQSLAMEAAAAREGFGIAYPLSLEGGWVYSRRISSARADRYGVDDEVNFILSIAGELITQGVADERRIFVAGASRGGLMAWTLACRGPGRLAAAAPMLSGMADDQLAECVGGPGFPILALGGTNDRIQPYDGWLFGTYRLLSMPDTLEHWRQRAGCSRQEASLLPAVQPPGPTRILHVTWRGCGPGLPVELLRVEGGGHRLPGLAATAPDDGVFGRRNRDIDTGEALWRFFAAVSTR